MHIYGSSVCYIDDVLVDELFFIGGHFNALMMCYASMFALSMMV